MPKPVTPLSGCDVFVTDVESRVLLIRRADNGLWALPGGCQELNETIAEAGVRECREETGLEIRITHLLGVFSSLRYEYVHYPWKDNVFNHTLFKAEVIGGKEATSDESPEVGWFFENRLPEFSDGHERRVRYGFNWLKAKEPSAHFE